MARTPNPEMIVLARQSRGVSQSDLAVAVGVSQGMVSKVEHGVAPPDDALLQKIADYLRYPVTFFFRPEHVRGTDSVCFHHRKRTSMPARLLAMTEGNMYITQLHVRSLLDELEIVAAHELMTLDPDRFEDGPRGVAQALRRMWQIPDGPIPDLIHVIEAGGGVVVFRDFGTLKLDGMSCWPKGCPPLFFINSAIPADRARLTLAHELGHLVMHWTAPDGDPEAQANAFAFEFLAPIAEIGPDLRRLTIASLPGLKAHWRVSMNAIVMAAKTTGALPEGRVRSLFVQLSRHGYRTVEPFPIPQESPRMIDTAIEVHRREHGYSSAELAMLVDLWDEEFQSLYVKDDSPRLRVLS
jgi:Zn-dependent peptidase ImmA (M78 family)/transcriptional regulator with XRE-family HTH domain